MAVVQIAPTGNPRNYIRASMTATDNVVVLGGWVSGGAIAIQLTGTWSGTVTFECSLDNTTWVTLNLTPSNDTTAVTSATGNGAWGDAVWGWKQVRARFSTATSGLVIVNIGFTPSQF